MKSPRLLFVAIAVLVLIGAAAYAYAHFAQRVPVRDTGAPTTAAAASGMRFEIADTPDKQQLGLGGRAEIPDNYGMLFVFPKASRYGFWMKDMLVPIDITWLSADGTILLVDRSVEPATYPHVFYPPSPVTYVVETRAGYAADHGWEVGTKVSLPAPY